MNDPEATADRAIETEHCLACRARRSTTELEVQLFRYGSKEDVRPASPSRASFSLPIALCAPCALKLRPRPYPRRFLLGLVMLCVAASFAMPLFDEILPSSFLATLEAGPWLLCMTFIGGYWVLQERRLDRAYQLHPAYAQLKACGYHCRYETLGEPLRQH